MQRCAMSVCRLAKSIVWSTKLQITPTQLPHARLYSGFLCQPMKSLYATRVGSTPSFAPPSIAPVFLAPANPLAGVKSSRGVTKFSLKTGKRKTVKAVLKRFMRLDWGGWIRTKCGRNKKMWKKTGDRKRRLRQHVLVNSTQSWLLDKMVTKYWRRPKYYVDDPYRPYHKRDEFPATRTKPLA